MLPCGWRLIRWAAAVGKKRGRSHHQSLSLCLTHTHIDTHMQTHIEASPCLGPRGSGCWKTDTNNSQIQSSPHSEKETSILHFPTDPLLKAKDQAPASTSTIISPSSPHLPCNWVGCHPPIKALRSLAQPSSQMVGQIRRGTITVFNVKCASC